MLRRLLSVIAAGFVGGCTPFTDWPALGFVPDAAQASAANEFHFGWELSGDPAVAPLQVFDNGQHVWLQWPDGQSIPAIFGQQSQGRVLLHPVRQGAYLRLDKAWSVLHFQGGSLTAQARRQSLSNERVSQVATLNSERKPATAENTSYTANNGSARDAAQALAIDTSEPAFTPLSPHPTTAQLFGAPIAVGGFYVAPKDENLRLALTRWAQQGGWTFASEHWAVDVDIPIAGEAHFGDEFVPAVRALLEATALGDYPLQACFYANQVLRVVSALQACDRRQGDYRS